MSRAWHVGWLRAAAAVAAALPIPGAAQPPADESAPADVVPVVVAPAPEDDAPADATPPPPFAPPPPFGAPVAAAPPLPAATVPAEPPAARGSDGTISVLVAPPPDQERGLVPVVPPARLTPVAPGTNAPATGGPAPPTAVASPAAPSPPPPGSAPLRAPPATGGETPAAEVLGRLLAEPAPNDPELGWGRPLTLIEALERPGDRARRLWIAQAYWKATAAVMVVRARADAVERLGLVAPGGDARDRDTIAAAVSAAVADLDTARAELAGARQELADLSRLPAGEPSPWPVDRPLAVPYQTHFATIFATRATTGRVRAIDRMLPSRHAAVEARARAVAGARRAAAAAEEDHARGTCPVEAVLVAHERLTASECDFARDVRTYNTDVAEYVMAVADTVVPEEQFARMLIGTPLPWRVPAPVAAAPGGVLVGGAVSSAGGPPLLTPPPVLVPPPTAVPIGN